MVTPRRTWLVAALGLVAVVLGVLVLRSPGAQVEVGWFSYGAPPSADLLDNLIIWNLVRAVGALLVLAGLLVLAHLLGVLAASRSGAVPALLPAGALVLAAVLVVGGLVAFVVLGLADRGEATISISKYVGPPPTIRPAWTVWTRDQTAAVLVVATGLVLGAVGVGLRRRSAPRPIDGSTNAP